MVVTEPKYLGLEKHFASCIHQNEQIVYLLPINNWHFLTIQTIYFLLLWLSSSVAHSLGKNRLNCSCSHAQQASSVADLYQWYIPIVIAECLSLCDAQKKKKITSLGAARTDFLAGNIGDATERSYAPIWTKPAPNEEIFYPLSFLSSVWIFKACKICVCLSLPALLAVREKGVSE